MKFLKILLASMLALALVCAPAMAEGTVITAMGGGSVTVAPDTAEISLGVSLEGRDVVEVQREVNERVAAIREALIAQGVSEEAITTGYVSVYGSYDYDENDQEKLAGYSAAHYLTVRTDRLEDAGRLIDAALAAGANRLDGVSFTKGDRGEAYSRALALAVQEARSHAQTMAEAEGRTLGALVSMEERDEGYGFSGFARTEDAGAGKGADTLLEAEGITVTASVLMTFELAD